MRRLEAARQELLVSMRSFAFPLVLVKKRALLLVAAEAMVWLASTRRARRARSRPKPPRRMILPVPVASLRRADANRMSYCLVWQLHVPESRVDAHARLDDVRFTRDARLGQPCRARLGGNSMFASRDDFPSLGRS